MNKAHIAKEIEQLLTSNQHTTDEIIWVGSDSQQNATTWYEFLTSTDPIPDDITIASDQWWIERANNQWIYRSIPKRPKTKTTTTTTQKRGLNILHLTETAFAYSPARFVDLINRFTGHSAKLIQVKNPNGMLGNPLGIQPLKAHDEIREALETADILHFHGRTLYARRRIGKFQIDSKYYNKPIVLHYHGSPEREKPHKAMIRGKNIKMLVSTPEMCKIFRSCEPQFFPNLIDEDHPLYLKRTPTTDKRPITICHHFSLHKRLKDTDIFERAHRNWQDNGTQMRFSFIEKCMLGDCISKRSQHDIVFDHLQGYYGLISIEAMAQGLAVVNGANGETMKYLRAFFGEEPPFITATRKNFLSVLGTLTRERVEDYARRSRKFMETNWSGRKNIHRLIEIYKKVKG